MDDEEECEEESGEEIEEVMPIKVMKKMPIKMMKKTPSKPKAANAPKAKCKSKGKCVGLLANIVCSMFRTLLETLFVDLMAHILILLRPAPMSEG